MGKTSRSRRIRESSILSPDIGLAWVSAISRKASPENCNARRWRTGRLGGDHVIALVHSGVDDVEVQSLDHSLAVLKHDEYLFADISEVGVAEDQGS
jgi:6-phosphogluconate dehydrogenase (decarboxylating)